MGILQKSAVLQGKRPWRTGGKVAEIQILLVFLEDRSGALPSKDKTLIKTMTYPPTKNST